MRVVERNPGSAKALRVSTPSIFRPGYEKRSTWMRLELYEASCVSFVFLLALFHGDGHLITPAVISVITIVVDEVEFSTHDNR
jgi:hypothetical protein